LMNEPNKESIESITCITSGIRRVIVEGYHHRLWLWHCRPLCFNLVRLKVCSTLCADGCRLLVIERSRAVSEEEMNSEESEVMTWAGKGKRTPRSW
jgi:hypothetical protein